ncbi:nuclear transport factor 2 family protein [Granulosicoccus sp. 3-233]|uniref:nuclear transport factor 2 family protein n=1 Tax=Granulosicoccus sp. 3-233 TaxID=3417969 RepID=UPI003D347684
MNHKTLTTAAAIITTTLSPTAFASDDNKALVADTLQAMFTDFDTDATRKLLAEDYIQHNPAVPTGAAPIIELLPLLKDSGITSTTFRMIAEGDLVVAHGLYQDAQLFGAESLVAFDVFRVEGGQVVEHWDNLQPLVTDTVSGNSMLDGARDIIDLDKTAANKLLVTKFVNDVLHGDAPEKITDYLSTETYIQHNPHIGNGLDGLGAAFDAMKEADITMSYSSTPLIVAEGNFVFTASAGEQGGTPTAFFDLFRVADGKIVEHWDVVSEIPDEMAHDNGKL